MVGEYLKGKEDLAKFARRVGVSEGSVQRWLKEAQGDRPRRERLVPVVVSAEGTASEQVEVALADGTALRIPVSLGPERLAALVAAVRRTC